MCELYEETKGHHNTAKRADHTTTVAEGSLWIDRNTFPIGPVPAHIASLETQRDLDKALGPGPKAKQSCSNSQSIWKLRVTGAQVFE